MPAKGPHSSFELVGVLGIAESPAFAGLGQQNISKLNLDRPMSLLGGQA